jgi:GDPmannose 4,6-dehydratase
MAAMLQQPSAADYVIASNEAHSLEDFVAAAFAEAGLEWRDHVDFDPSIARPSEIAYSLGNPAKAKKDLGWQPKVRFAEIVARMVRGETQGAAAVS